MRRSLNESVKINATGLKGALLRKRTNQTVNSIVRRIQGLGGEVREDIEGNTVFMIVNNLSEDDIIDEFEFDVPFLEDYIVESSLGESFNDFPPYESVRINEYKEFDEDDELNDCDGPNCKKSEFDECDKFQECGSYNEDEDFDECQKFESYSPRKARPSIRARRKGCCPPKKVSLAEALGRKTIKKAMNKAVNEKRQTMARVNRLKAIKNELGEQKYNFIVECIKAKKPNLYSNKKINGKNMDKYSSKELYDIMKTVNEQIKKLENNLKNLNESLTLNEKIELSDKIETKKRLLNLLDEELTYRLTIKKMLKEDEEMTNPLEPLPMGPEVSSDDSKDDNDDDKSADDDEKTDDEKDKEGNENPEEDEEIELSRVVITVDTEEAVNDLKDACVEAGIPEDAIEIETPGDEAEDEEAENGEEAEGEETAEDANESKHYNQFRKLLIEDDEPAEGEDTEGDETEGEDTEGEDEESDEPKEYKFVLTDTDYIEDLANVLDQQYGITKEEFEEQIGGEIVSEGDDEEKDGDEEKDTEDSEESDEESSKGDDAVDAMTPEDLDKLFGGE